MIRWLRQQGIPSLLDVKDQWPEIFLDALPVKVKFLGKIALWPYYWLARYAMRNATGISAMTESFLSWALDFGGRCRCKEDVVTPLTAPRDVSNEDEMSSAREWWAAHGVREDGKIRFCFIGSHTRSFDFAPVIAAAKHLLTTAPNCELVICGNGERSLEWQEAAKGLTNVHFPGWVDSPRIRVLAQLASAFIAPYENTDGFERSIPNKIVDALSLGLPIVTPLRGEVSELISRYHVGLRYGTDTNCSLQGCLARLGEDVELQRRMAKNAAELYEREFAFEKVYAALVVHIESLVVSDDERKRSE
jgi:glycosyltransferase involved in cell wall biosynthesis